MAKSLIIFFLFIFFSCKSTLNTTKDSSPKWHYSTYKNQTILVGEISPEQLKNPKLGNWYSDNYNQYRPDKQVVQSLAKALSNKKIEIYMGTWCPDSREHVPPFIKILDSAGFDKKNLRLFALPRNFKEMEEIQKKNIIRVPTFIIYQNGVEKGRIIEYPMETLESDLLHILQGNYKHELQN